MCSFFRYQCQIDEDKEPQASKVVLVIYYCLKFNLEKLRVQPASRVLFLITFFFFLALTAKAFSRKNGAATQKSPVTAQLHPVALI